MVWRGHRVRVAQTGAGHPLLLISGLGSHLDMWAPFAAEFPESRIIRFDMPGTGRSSTPLYPISIAALAQLAVAVLDHYGIPRADVVGFSYGGAVAQQAARDYPSRIRRLVLAATTCGIGSVPGSIPALTALATPLRFYSRPYFEQVAAALYGGATGRNPDVRAQQMRIRDHAPPPSSYGYAMQMMGANGWSSLPFLADIPHETLIINGNDDPLVPVENAQILADRIPRARLKIVKRAGHLLLWDDAPNVAAHIKPFINRVRLKQGRMQAQKQEQRRERDYARDTKVPITPWPTLNGLRLRKKAGLHERVCAGSRARGATQPAAVD